MAHLRRQSPSSFSSISHSDLCPQIESSQELKPLLQEVYDIMTRAYAPLRQYRNKKQQKPQFGQNQILNLQKNVKKGCVKLKKLIQNFDKTFQRQQQQKEKVIEQLNNIKRRNGELLDKNRFIESQYHRGMIDLQSNFNKKQQDYQSLINSFVKSIIDARKIWSDFEDKVTKLVTTLEDKNQIEEQVREFYSTVITMMHSMSTKPSINDSHIEQPCEMSSIIRHEGEDDLLPQDAHYEEYQDQDADAELKRIQESLKILGSRGLFNKQNQEFLFKFLDLKQRFSWSELTKINYYTQLLQFLKEGGNAEESLDQVHAPDNTIIENYNEDSSSFFDYNHQKRFLSNFQQKAEDSLDGPSQINITGMGNHMESFV